MSKHALSPFQSDSTGFTNYADRSNCGDTSELSSLSRPIDGPLQPRNHAMHDLLVVLLQHHRMSVAEYPGLRQHIDRHLTADRGHFLLKLARRIDTILGVVSDHDEDRNCRELLSAFGWDF